MNIHTLVDATRPVASPLHDPTGTHRLRAAFRADMDARWAKAKRMVRESILAQDPLIHIVMADRVAAFNRWLDEALKGIVLGDGAWMAKYLDTAFRMARHRAHKLVVAQDALTVDQFDDAKELAIASLAVTELQGIDDAVSQQATRAYLDLGLTDQRKTASAIVALMDKVGVARSRMLVNAIIIKAFSSSTLDAFRRAGIRRIGTMPERRRRQKRVAARDAVAVRDQDDDELVNVLTAGDDDVCVICEDISEGSPYDIDDAESLIPAHPNCRCAFVPADDARFAELEFDAAPREAAGVLFVTPQGHGLFTKRVDNGFWSIPAGMLEPGEQPVEAAQREAAEEVGHPGDHRVVPLGRREHGGLTFHTFAQPLRQRFDPILNGEHNAHRWAPLDNPPEPLHPGLRATLRELRASARRALDYDPNEPRVEAGSPGAGQWTSGGEGQARQLAAAKAQERPSLGTQLRPLARYATAHEPAPVEARPEATHEATTTTTAPPQAAGPPPLPSSGTTGAVTMKDFERREDMKVDIHGAFRGVPGPENEAARTAHEAEFLKTWNDRVGMSPGDFKQALLGKLNGNLQLDWGYDDEHPKSLGVQVQLQDEEDDRLGSMTLGFNFDKNTVDGGYLALNDSEQGRDYGKKIFFSALPLAQKMGMDKIITHANIDVGGYAWARYGFVPYKQGEAGPGERGWSSLSSDIEDRIDRLSRGTPAERDGGTHRERIASSWDELSSDQQDRIYESWQRSTEDEFRDSDIESWRENGGDLHDTKMSMVSDYGHSYPNGPGGTWQRTYPAWATDALHDYVEKRAEDGKAAMPFTEQQILHATDVDFHDRYDNGEGDLDVTWDDDKLQEPIGYQAAQMTLPGVEPIKPHEMMTDEMREGVEGALQKSFDKVAEKNRDDAEPPDYISENVSESQSDYWSSMRDRDRWEWAESNEPDELETELEDEPEESETVERAPSPGEMTKEDADALRKLTSSQDPKAVWAIADSKWGKKLLLDTDWYGALDMKDPETKQRLFSYLASKMAKRAGAAAPA